jgi:Fe2+ or Zn2+ uptake regulation protein
MNTIHEKFKSTVHSQGFRVTPQRQIILDAIHGGNGHVALPEIIERSQAKLPALSLPTIYRTLDFLCEIRVVTALRVGNTTYFEIAEEEPHHHLVCRNCGAVEVLPHVDIQNLFGKIERSYKFKVDMNHLGLFGLCCHCKVPSN